MKNKILISGWYGHGNIGDEIILETMIDNFKSEIDNVKIEVLSDNPIYTKNTHDVISTNNFPLKTRRYLNLLLKKKNPFLAFNSIRKNDVFVMGGGGFLSDWQTHVPWGWLKQILIAKFFGKKTMIYAIGAGPFKTKKGKLIVKKIVNNFVDFITVRDETSKKELLNCGVEEAKIHVTADPVVNYLSFNINKDIEKDIRNYIPNFDTNFMNVGITVASLFHNDKWNNDPQKYYNEYVYNLTKSIKEILRKYENVKIYFLPFMMTSDDISFSEMINKLIGGKGIVLKAENNINRVLNIYKNLDCIIAMRYHANILATVLDKPTIPIVYHHKVGDYVKKLGLEDRILDLGNGENWRDNIFDYNELVSQFDNIYNNNYPVSDVKKKLSELQKKEQNNTYFLKRLL